MLFNLIYMDLQEKFPSDLEEAFDKAVYTPGKEPAHVVFEKTKRFILDRKLINRFQFMNLWRSDQTYVIFCPGSTQVLYLRNLKSESLMINRMGQDLFLSASLDILRLRGFLLKDYHHPFKMQEYALRVSTPRDSKVRQYKFYSDYNL